MSALDDLKQKWTANNAITSFGTYNETEMNQIIRSRIKKQNSRIMQYFWATFTFHITIYALLSHVVIKYWAMNEVLYPAIFGIAITIPFTSFMMKRYKEMAITKIAGNGLESVHDYVKKQQNLLSDFFTFKKRYEFILIPLNAAIGVYIVFELFVPGGVAAFPIGAAVTFVGTLLSCVAAIRMENKKNFAQPLQDLQVLLDDYRQ